METNTFTALCERAGRWWTIRVPQVEGLSAQVRSLDQAPIIARQSIARVLGLPVEAIQVEVLSDVPTPVARALQLRHAARQAVEAAAVATGEALQALSQERYLFHDAATMLGLSPAEIEHYGPGPDGMGDQSPADSGPLLAAGK